MTGASRSDAISAGLAVDEIRPQGDLWSVRAIDYAEVQEPTFLPLYESVLARPELAAASALLDVGCGPGLAVQTLSKKIGRVAGVDEYRDSPRRADPAHHFSAGKRVIAPADRGIADARAETLKRITAHRGIATGAKQQRRRNAVRRRCENGTAFRAERV